MLIVKVEATSANVCVGFDVLGIALNLVNEFTFERKNEFSFKGFDKEYLTKENNLVYEAYKTVFDYIDKYGDLSFEEFPFSDVDSLIR